MNKTFHFDAKAKYVTDVKDLRLSLQQVSDNQPWVIMRIHLAISTPLFQRKWRIYIPPYV
jgi:hypothetical protein